MSRVFGCCSRFLFFVFLVVVPSLSPFPSPHFRRQYPLMLHSIFAPFRSHRCSSFSVLPFFACESSSTSFCVASPDRLSLLLCVAKTQKRHSSVRLYKREVTVNEKKEKEKEKESVRKLTSRGTTSARRVGSATSSRRVTQTQANGRRAAVAKSKS
jgi:hypothetical protein